MSRSFDPLRNELLQHVRQKSGWLGLAQSIDGVASLISAIADTDDDSWVNHVDGLSDEERVRFQHTFQPHVTSIRQYFSPPSSPSSSQHGGVNETTPSSPESGIAETGAVAETAGTGAETAGTGAETAGTATGTAAGTAGTATGTAAGTAVTTMGSLMPALDLDGAFMSMVEKTNQLNHAAEYMASQYGLTRLERDFDTKDDFRIVPEFLTNMLASLGPSGIAAKQFLDKLKVPYRFLIFLVFLYLDVARLTAATMGRPTQQKTLTVILALLELFRGDWKKAVLTFMGFYGTTPLLAGQQVKILLYLFERLSPTLQDRMVYGTWDAGKSLLIGILLAIFQLTAPLSVRKPFLEMLQKLSEAKQGLDQSLIEAGLEPRSDEFAPTWDDINRLQAVNDDPTFICSCEYEEVLKNIGDSTLIKLILQLLRLPVNEEMRAKYTCVDHTPCKPYAESLRMNQAPAPAPATAPAPAPAPEVKTQESEPETPSPPVSEPESTPLKPQRGGRSLRFIQKLHPRQQARE